MIDSFLGEKVDYWITLKARAETLNVSGLIREIAELKEAQKSSLTDSILNAFETPEAIPMTDGERIWLLRNLYDKAKLIRQSKTK